MPSPLDTLEVSPTQGTTAGKQLAPDDLLALRAMFLLLDAWDRNAEKANGESIQRHISPVSQLACRAPRQGSAVPSPRRHDHLYRTR